jgi:hypothetical protein
MANSNTFSKVSGEALGTSTFSSYSQWRIFDFIDTLATCQNLPEITVLDLIAELKRQLILNTVRKFQLDLERLRGIVEDKAAARRAFSKAIVEISTLNPTNIILSLTDSKSIYFRIYNNLNFEIHFEMFYSNDNDGIEVVATVYQNDQVKLKTFGSLEEVLNSIRNKISVSSAKPVARYNEYELSI